MNMETFSAGTLSVSTLVSNTTDVVVPQKVDILVCAASWDARCLEFLSASWSATRAICVRYADQGASGEGATHYAALVSLLKERCTYDPVEVTVDSLDEQGTFSTIKNALIEALSAHGDRAHIMIDISSIPKLYFTHLLAIILHHRISSRISVFYAEGVYSLGTKPVHALQDGALISEHKEISLKHTEGPWRSVAVPFLEGEFSSGAKRQVLASLGGEGAMAYQLIAQYDPDKLAVILPIPGFKVEYNEIAEHESRRIVANFPLDNRLEKIHAGNVGGVFNYCASSSVSDPSFDVLLLCCGPKTHALGLALAAFTLKKPALICRMPKKFVQTSITPTGISWMYSIRATNLI